MHLHGKETLIEERDVDEAKNLLELRKGGGKSQVPCLRIEHESEKGKVSVQWLYESEDIIAYIKKNNLAN